VGRSLFIIRTPIEALKPDGNTLEGSYPLIGNLQQPLTRHKPHIDDNKFFGCSQQLKSVVDSKDVKVDTSN
jgi:hypothetical protein